MLNNSDYSLCSVIDWIPNYCIPLRDMNICGTFDLDFLMTAAEVKTVNIRNRS